MINFLEWYVAHGLGIHESWWLILQLGHSKENGVTTGRASPYPLRLSHGNESPCDLKPLLPCKLRTATEVRKTFVTRLRITLGDFKTWDVIGSFYSNWDNFRNLPWGFWQLRPPCLRFENLYSPLLMLRKDYMISFTNFTKF